MSQVIEQTEKEEIEYSIIAPEDYHLLEPIFKVYGAKVPNPDLSRIACASYKGEIIGFYGLQAKIHAEPMWIKPEWKGSKVWIKLAAMLDNLRGSEEVFIVAENPESERMCISLGLEKVEFPVYRK